MQRVRPVGNRVGLQRHVVSGNSREMMVPEPCGRSAITAQAGLTTGVRRGGVLGIEILCFVPADPSGTHQQHVTRLKFEVLRGDGRFEEIDGDLELRGVVDRLIALLAVAGDVDEDATTGDAAL